MQLKLKRSQRDGGVVSKTAIFCIDARVEFTTIEKQHIQRYKLANQVIYNSDASRRLLEKSEAQADGSMVGNLKSLASVALAAMKLNISISSLERGQHVECKSLDELLGAEQAIMTACQNLKGYLDTAATFDGREVLFDFATGEPAVIAQAATPAPMLVLEPKPVGAAAQAAQIPHQEGTDAPLFARPRTAAAGGDAPWDNLTPEQRKLVMWAGGAFVLLLILYSCAHH